MILRILALVCFLGVGILGPGLAVEYGRASRGSGLKEGTAVVWATCAGALTYLFWYLLLRGRS